MNNSYVSTLIASDHAKERWAERFPDRDFDYELRGARRCGKRTRQNIGKACIGNKWKLHHRNKWVYLISQSEIVFVVRFPDRIVTVFQYERAA